MFNQFKSLAECPLNNIQITPVLIKHVIKKKKKKVRFISEGKKLLAPLGFQDKKPLSELLYFVNS